MAGSFPNSFYTIATEVVNLNPTFAAAQRVLIDSITAESPILKEIPFEKSSHALYNDFSALTDVEGIDIVEFDAPLPEIRASSQLDRVNLTPLGGQTIFGADLAERFGGPKAYIEAKLPSIMRKSGMKIEKSLFMHNFLGACARHGKLLSATATADITDDIKYATMVAVTWTAGEVCGLVSPTSYEGPNQGRLFETKWLNGGNTFYDTKSNGDKIISYAAYVKMLFGIQLENRDKIAALVNIDSVPTANQLVSLVEAAQAGESTRIYCSRSTMTAIASNFAQSQKGNGLIAVMPNAQVEVMGVPLVTSHNIPVKMGKIDGGTYIA